MATFAKCDHPLSDAELAQEIVDMWVQNGRVVDRVLQIIQESACKTAPGDAFRVLMTGMASVPFH